MRSAFDRYDRSDLWSQLCEEVAKIRIGRDAGADVISLPLVAVAGDSPYSALRASALKENGTGK